jgi:hypothetical protein
MMAEAISDMASAVAETRLRSLAGRAGLLLVKDRATGKFTVANGLGVSLTRGAVSRDEAERYLRLYLGEEQRG